MVEAEFAKNFVNWKASRLGESRHDGPSSSGISQELRRTELRRTELRLGITTGDHDSESRATIKNAQGRVTSI